mmetsp:Transcript_81168/g.243259  ORF Transcript_81168/g.243259 Transcript_81168/m.243259 type:complete len:242 (+) Transcript_81168:1307-2032(+)
MSGSRPVADHMLTVRACVTVHRSLCVCGIVKGTDLVPRHYSQRSHSGSPVCCRRSRTSQRSISTTQPASARAEHARATRLQVQQAAAAIHRRTTSACAAHAPMHPPSSAVLPAAMAAPHAPTKLIGGRWAHARGLGGMLLLSSLPMSLRRRRGYQPCSSASRDPWPIWTGTRPRVSSASPSRSRVAPWPHGRVRGTPDLRHEKVRTPYTGRCRQRNNGTCRKERRVGAHLACGSWRDYMSD